eukprot:COSAG02_NODE_708_length_18231_cov_53.208416_14_plen_46_part_00
MTTQEVVVQLKSQVLLAIARTSEPPGGSSWCEPNSADSGDSILIR